MLEIIQEMLDLLDELNEEVDYMAKHPINRTGIRSITIKKLRDKVTQLEVAAE